MEREIQWIVVALKLSRVVAVDLPTIHIRRVHIALRMKKRNYIDDDYHQSVSVVAPSTRKKIRQRE